ncbi:hypothetical protein [Micromonospora sp. NPDC047730]|uniref:hypothetical protein n=1 Tax=Micromonospora sp. NPDC047730 TaxID=3364253 RepID=UPI003720207C
MANLFSFVAEIRRMATDGDLARLAMPGVRLSQINRLSLSGTSYLAEVRDELADFVEEHGRLPREAEPDEIAAAPLGTRDDAHVWALFVGLGGWLDEDAPNRSLTTDGATRTLEGIGRRLVYALLEQAEEA